jgi:hypothetical protein
VAWTRRRKRRALLLVGVVTAAVVTIAALLWIPISEEQSGYTIIGFKPYSYETVYPLSAPNSNFSYRGVLFDFQGLPPECGRWRSLRERDRIPRGDILVQRLVAPTMPWPGDLAHVGLSESARGRRKRGMRVGNAVPSSGRHLKAVRAPSVARGLRPRWLDVGAARSMTRPR